MNIKIDNIVLNDRKRKLNKDKVMELADSFKLLGQLEPITVASKNDQYVLLAGLHRLEAAKLLGWETINAQVFVGNELECELVEIDENLISYNLTVLEQGEQLKRRNEILEAIGIRAKKGDNRYTFRYDTVSGLKTTEDIAKKVGLSERSAQRRIQIARDILPEVKEKIRNTPIADSTTQLLDLARLDKEMQVEVANLLNDDMTISKAIQETKRKQITEKLNDIATVEAKEVEGVFDVIVVDPPWPMEKIERDVAPNQVEFEYPTMSIDEIKALELPCAEDCHVWLWTTHKYLPVAFEILKAWNLKYVCTFVWHKPGGFQPFELPQYNCEFALYARRGTPKFVDLKDFKLCFDAPRGAHSEKPELFYDLVRRVTAGRRLDMFNRRKIEGYETWGKEAYNE